MNNLKPKFNNFENLNKMEKEKFELEIDKYRELEKEINSIDGLDIEDNNHKISLSFFIEEIKKDNPKNWEKVVDNFREQLSNIVKERGEVEATWFLADKINEAYFSFLDNRINELEDGETKTKVQLIKKMVEQNVVLNEMAKKNNSKVSFGGVSSCYAPKWRESL
ncbi:hypothetical protein EOL94_03410 [bacterium]|nr:hypothetical protein [bacterium]